MKKIISLIVALVMAVTCLAACDGAPLGKTPEQYAEETVRNCFDALKAGDLETASLYMDEDVTDVGDSEDDSMVNSVIVEKVFGALEYNIVSSEKVDDNTVIVKTAITNVDMKPVFAEFFVQALQYALANAFSENPPSEEESDAQMTQIFADCMSKEDLAKVTNEVEIKVTKGEENWKLESSDALADALLGGLEGAIEEIQNSFNSESEN